MPGAHGHHEHRNVRPERSVATRQSRHRQDRNTSALVINPELATAAPHCGPYRAPHKPVRQSISSAADNDPDFVLGYESRGVVGFR